jgi:hypothetical protein
LINLHYAILSGIVRHGFAQSPNDLAKQFDISKTKVSSALHALADDHGIVLHPKSDEIWVAHPFSLAPTGFLVRAGNREWWGNCAWCSLGVAGLVGGDVEIVAALGADGRQVTVRIIDGKLIDKEYVIHFPIKMANAWDNVIYTCSVILLFENETQVDRWCLRHGKPKGDVRPIDQIWDFSREWYGRHLDTDWRKWTAKEAASMFARHGLNGPIWDISPHEGRF